MRNSAAASRRKRAVESFRTAAECIGPIEPGISLFAITRGQWSMIDAILHCLDQTGPAEVSLWTWTVAEYEVQCLERLRRDGRVIAGRLVIDYGARSKNAGLIGQWKDVFGPESVRYALNHGKIARVKTDRLRLLLCGSMNLNFNPRFEQFDLTEGGADFDLVEQIEEGLPVLPDNASGKEVYAGSRVGEAFSAETLELFRGARVWGK